MKIYFTYVDSDFINTQNRDFLRNQVNFFCSVVYEKQNWEVAKHKPEEDKEESEENGESEENEESGDKDRREEGDSRNGESIYRKSLMNLVDHVRSLRLLERRSIYLPKNDPIQLSLVAVKHSEMKYFPWGEMEKIIHEMCKDGGVIIDKIKTHLGKTCSEDRVVKSFRTLLAHHGGRGKAPKHNNPVFPSTIHCESSLAAILCQLYTSDGRDSSDLWQVFQVCVEFM
jgi:hypothetical protein